MMLGRRNISFTAPATGPKLPSSSSFITRPPTAEYTVRYGTQQNSLLQCCTVQAYTHSYIYNIMTAVNIGREWENRGALLPLVHCVTQLRSITSCVCSTHTHTGKVIDSNEQVASLAVLFQTARSNRTSFHLLFMYSLWRPSSPRSSLSLFLSFTVDPWNRFTADRDWLLVCPSFLPSARSSVRPSRGLELCNRLSVGYSLFLFFPQVLDQEDCHRSRKTRLIILHF